MEARDVRQLVVVSDLHCGCQLGLCPAKGMRLDEGGRYLPNTIQKKVWRHWREFWDVWVPQVTQGEPFAVVCNGDAIDGVHHGSTHQISHNLKDQENLVYEVLAPIVEQCGGLYYHIRGTEAHVGKSGDSEERLADRLGAIPNDEGQHARYELWKWLRHGKRKALIHALHHIGTTSSSAYESTAVHRELVEAFTEAGRWGNKPPDVIVRAHRHRDFETRMPSLLGYASACVTAGWQAKTPFAWKIAGARQTQPQFGGRIVRVGDEDVYTRSRVWSLDRPRPE